MTNQELMAQIQALLSAASPFVGIFGPQLMPFLVLGQALAKIEPELYEDVLRFLNKAEPTESEVKELAERIAALAKPENL